MPSAPYLGLRARSGGGTWLLRRGRDETDKGHRPAGDAGRLHGLRGLWKLGRRLGELDSGSSGGAATSTSSSEAGTAAPTTGCGSIPQQMPDDPDGVLAALPKDVQAAYNLFPEAVGKSAWADWKPAGSGPYKIYFSPGNISTPFIQDLQKEFDKLKASSDVITKVTTQDSNNNVQTQIQQIRQAVREKYDLLIVLPLSPAADAPVLEAAGKAGIPIITPLNASANEYVIGVEGNVILNGASLGSGPRPDHGRQGQRARDAGHPRRPGQRRRAQGRRQGVRGVRGRQGRRQAGRSVPARRGQGADAAVPVVAPGRGRRRGPDRRHGDRHHPGLPADGPQGPADRRLRRHAGSARLLEREQGRLRGRGPRHRAGSVRRRPCGTSRWGCSTGAG